MRRILSTGAGRGRAPAWATRSLVGIAMALALAFPTFAVGDDGDTASQTATALENVPGVVQASDSIPTSSDANSAIITSTPSVAVDVPKDPAAGVTLDPGVGAPIAIGIPGGTAAADAQTVAPGVVSYADTAPQASAAAQAVEPEADSAVVQPAVAAAAGPEATAVANSGVPVASSPIDPPPAAIPAETTTDATTTTEPSPTDTTTTSATTTDAPPADTTTAATTTSSDPPPAETTITTATTTTDPPSDPTPTTDAAARVAAGAIAAAASAGSSAPTALGYRRHGRGTVSTRTSRVLRTFDDAPPPPTTTDATATTTTATTTTDATTTTAPADQPPADDPGTTVTVPPPPPADLPPVKPLALGVGVRLFTIIAGPDAPTDYSFPIGLPEGGQLQATDQSYLILDSAGVVVSMISQPWAKDANGVTLPVKYSLDGTTLNLHVDHQGSAYPVVIDPKVSDGGASARAAAAAAAAAHAAALARQRAAEQHAAQLAAAQAAFRAAEQAAAQRAAAEARAAADRAAAEAKARADARLRQLIQMEAIEEANRQAAARAAAVLKAAAEARAAQEAKAAEERALAAAAEAEKRKPKVIVSQQPHYDAFTNIDGTWRIDTDCYDGGGPGYISKFTNRRGIVITNDADRPGPGNLTIPVGIGLFIFKEARANYGQPLAWNDLYDQDGGVCSPHADGRRYGVNPDLTGVGAPYAEAGGYGLKAHVVFRDPYADSVLRVDYHWQFLWTTVKLWTSVVQTCGGGHCGSTSLPAWVKGPKYVAGTNPASGYTQTTIYDRSGNPVCAFARPGSPSNFSSGGGATGQCAANGRARIQFNYARGPSEADCEGVPANKADNYTEPCRAKLAPNCGTNGCLNAVFRSFPIANWEGGPGLDAWARSYTSADGEGATKAPDGSTNCGAPGTTGQCESCPMAGTDVYRPSSGNARRWEEVGFKVGGWNDPFNGVAANAFAWEDCSELGTASALFRPFQANGTAYSTYASFGLNGHYDIDG